MQPLADGRRKFIQGLKWIIQLGTNYALTISIPTPRRVKQQVRDSEQMKKRLAKRELQRNLEQINTDVAGVHHDELANDFTPDELRWI